MNDCKVTTCYMNEIREEKQSLWLLTASPVIWAAHLMLSYSAASIWCAKVAGPGGTLQPVRLAIGVLTALSLPATGSSAGAVSAGTVTAMPNCRTTTTRRKTAIASWASPRCCCRG
jgi:hypothetical protein